MLCYTTEACRSVTVLMHVYENSSCSCAEKSSKFIHWLPKCCDPVISDP